MTNTPPYCVAVSVPESDVFVWYRKPYGSMLLAQEFKQKEGRVFLAGTRYKCEGVKVRQNCASVNGRERIRRTERNGTERKEAKMSTGKVRSAE